MRITIDTELQAIIVPNSYYMQVDKLNEVITEAGGKALDYNEYIKNCFEKAYATRVVRTADVANLKPRKKAKKDGTPTKDDEKDNKDSNEDKKGEK